MSAYYYTLDYNGRSLVRIDFQSVHGMGKVNPRLNFAFSCKTLDPAISVELASLRLDVMSGQELLGTGVLKAAGQQL